MVQEARIGAAKNTRFQSGRPKEGQMDLKKDRKEQCWLDSPGWALVAGSSDRFGLHNKTFR